MVRAALDEAAKKREMRYNDLKRIEKGIRRHFHDDITVIVIYLDHHRQGLSTKLKRDAIDYTNAPIDIFTHNSDRTDQPLWPSI